MGCDCAFGSDHDFLDSLPDAVNYFVGVRETEHIYRRMPEVVLPMNNSTMGRRCKYPRAVEHPVCVKSVLFDASVPWVRRTVAEGQRVRLWRMLSVCVVCLVGVLMIIVGCMCLSLGCGCIFVGMRMMGRLSVF